MQTEKRNYEEIFSEMAQWEVADGEADDAADESVEGQEPVEIVPGEAIPGSRAQ